MLRTNPITCVTFVRSRQSMQFDLITPFCSANISPFDPKRKYLLSWKATIKMGNRHNCNSDMISKTKVENELTPVCSFFTLVFQSLLKFRHTKVVYCRSFHCHIFDESQMKHIWIFMNIHQKLVSRYNSFSHSMSELNGLVQIVGADHSATSGLNFIIMASFSWKVNTL